jgi:hypothetical protein
MDASDLGCKGRNPGYGGAAGAGKLPEGDHLPPERWKAAAEFDNQSVAVGRLQGVGIA